ncbi:MAG TPA: 50S ribosomal protein L4 [Nitriliruptorales bacterium]|nr:50S ribosomal protein L4 [Nitriliruptorales bacterium]
MTAASDTSVERGRATRTVDVRDLSGATVGSAELSAEWFTGDVNVPVMHQVVTAQLANARHDTAKTRSRGEVRGGGRKPWRQKGTGRARHGSIRAPQWTGGGVAHGRSGEENHHLRVNRKMRRLALRSALTDRANGGNVDVVRGLALPAPRTKDAFAALVALGHADRRVLIVLGALDTSTVKSFRNLPRVHTLTVDQLNTYDVLKSDVVVFDEAALPLIGTGKRAAGIDTGQRSGGSDTPPPTDGRTQDPTAAEQDRDERASSATEDPEVSA